MSTGSEKAIVALRGGSEFWGPRVAISLVGARAMQARFHGVCRLLESLQTQKPREKANEVAALSRRAAACGRAELLVKKGAYWSRAVSAGTASGSGNLRILDDFG